MTPTRGKAILHHYDWTYLLVFIFNLKENASDAQGELKRWIEQEAKTWCGDDDDDDEDGHREQMPSYLVMGTRDNRIQGPAFYVLVAGATDHVDYSVRDWNRMSGRTCTRFCFQAFGEKAHLRRKALIRFLSGLFDLNCLVWYRVYKRHRIPEEDTSSGRRPV